MPPLQQALQERKPAATASPAAGLSTSDPLLQVKQTADTLTFLLHGSSSAFEAEPLREVISVKLADAKLIENVVFDLTDVIPVYNIVGRVFDIALDCGVKRAASSMATILRMPRDFYEDLRRTDDLPEPDDVVTIKGLSVHLVENSPLLVPAATSSRKQTTSAETVLVTYTGKIRAFEGDTVFVSLFSSGKDSDEIAGELDRRQFPEGELSIGQIFKYRVVSKGPGMTEVKIVPVQRLSIHPDDLIDLYEKVSKSIPPDDKKSQG